MDNNNFEKDNVNTANGESGQNGQNGQNGNNNVNIPGGSDLGSQVVKEALKYVGNPYVWGGDSLTNGCDCSGFVVQIYKLFGVDLSASRQSSLLRSVGKAIQEKPVQQNRRAKP